MRNTIVPPKNQVPQAKPAPTSPAPVQTTQCGFCGKVRSHLEGWKQRLLRESNN